MFFASLLVQAASQVPEGYTACTKDLEDTLELCWNLDSRLLDLEVRAHSDGYIAFGFPKTRGHMVGADAVIGWLDPSLENGSFVGDFHLGSTKSADVKVAGNQRLVSLSLQADVMPNVLIIRFQRLLQLPGQPKMDPSNVPFIWARGDAPAAGSQVLSRHFSKGSAVFDFVVGDLKRDTDPWKRAHAICMGLAYAVFMPAGVMVARFGKSKKNWFGYHRGLQAVTVALAAAGFSIAFARFPTSGHDLQAHKGVGVAMLVLTVVLPLLGFIRPEQYSSYRGTWFILHGWGGRILVTLAAFQIYLGLAILKPGVGWTVLVILGMLTWLFSFVWLHTARQRNPTVDNLGGIYNPRAYVGEGLN